MLHRQGLLTLETPIVLILPDLPSAWSAVTVHHLLTHQSGIPNYVAITGDGPEDLDELTNQAALNLVLANPTLEFTPGVRASYSNTGYILLAMIIERLTEMSYAEFMQESVFEPLAMTSSASLMTAPSMHPPDTEPRNAPCSSTNS